MSISEAMVAYMISGTTERSVEALKGKENHID